MNESSFERLVNIQSYSDADLKGLAEDLAEQEAELSKRRRLLQGELDIVRAELVRRLRQKTGSTDALVKDGDIAALSRILANKGTGEDVAGD